MKSSVRVVCCALVLVLTLWFTGCSSSSHPIAVSLAANPTTIDQGQTANITATVSNDSKNAGVTWSVSGGGTLTNGTTTSVTYNAPASVASNSTATITATSVSDTSKTATVTVTVSALTVTASAATGSIDPGQTSNVTATVANDFQNAGVTWSVSGGGTLSSQTTTSVTYNAPATVTSQFKATVTATSVSDTSKTSTAQITVNTLPAVSTSNPPGAATAGTAYSYQLTATGGATPYTWSLYPTTQTLPAGLTLSSGGLISGTPTHEAGSSGPFQFKVTDAVGGAATQSFTITVNPAPALTVTTASLPAASVGAAYSAPNLAATGGIGPYTWSKISGPAWLSVSSAGALSGTPTSNTGSPVAVVVQVTDSQSMTANSSGLSVTINVATLQITTTSLPAGTVNTAYSGTVNATGGVPPYTWSLTNTPPSWLSISSGTSSPYAGALSGTPTSAGTTPSFTIEVQDAEGTPASATANFTITVNAQSACAGTLNNSLLTGNYAFFMKGWSGASTASSAAGSFVADGNGNLASGLIDIADQGATPANSNTTFTGTYCVGSDNLAILNIAPAAGSAATFAAAINNTQDSGNRNGYIIGYDASGKLISGLLRQQTTADFSTGSISGNYAFGLVGADQGGDRFALAGQFDSSGGTLTGEADFDDSNGGKHSVGTTQITGSAFSIASNGRGTASIFASEPNQTINFVFYVVNSNEMIMMASDSTETPPMIMTGSVFAQASNLSNSTINGTAIMSVADVDYSGSSPVGETQSGILTATASSTSFSLNMDDMDVNNGGLMSATVTGNFSVASNGRMTLSNLTGCPGGCNHSPVFYVYAINSAFEVGTGGSGQFGQLTAQTGTSFSASALAGAYLGGTREVVIDGRSVSVAEPSFSSSNGTISGTSFKTTVNSGSPQTTTATTGTISGDYCPATTGTTCSGSSSNGRFLVTSSGALQNIVYAISDTEFVIMDADSGDNDPKLQDFHQ